MLVLLPRVLVRSRELGYRSFVREVRPGQRLLSLTCVSNSLDGDGDELVLAIRCVNVRIRRYGILEIVTRCVCVCVCE